MIDIKEDLTWPACSACSWDQTKNAFVSGWCEHVADLIRNNRDHLPMEVGAGLTSYPDPLPHIAVPYLPNQGIFAEVGWDVEMYPGARMMYLVRRMPGWNKQDFNKEFLGLWSAGEKRASICLTVRDWMRGESLSGEIECPATTHGFKEEMAISKLDELQKEINQFHCITEGCCYFCNQKMTQISLPDPDDNFLDPAEGPTPETLAAARARLNRTGRPF